MQFPYSESKTDCTILTVPINVTINIETLPTDSGSRTIQPSKLESTKTESIDVKAQEPS